MTTTPPTATEMDAWFLSSGNISNLINDANRDGSTSFTMWWVGYTQNDSWQQFVQLDGNPSTSSFTTYFLQGLIAAYGAVIVREYTWSVPTDAASFLASGTEETFINDPVNWVSAP